jgi:hypothetical protein
MEVLGESQRYCLEGQRVPVPYRGRVIIVELSQFQIPLEETAELPHRDANDPPQVFWITNNTDVTLHSKTVRILT